MMNCFGNTEIKNVKLIPRFCRWQALRLYTPTKQLTLQFDYFFNDKTLFCEPINSR